jgi:GH15 family glucan-1,4-alpha-glucosidase
MCWAACDRLARIAEHRALPERARLWQDRATEIRGAIESRAFDAKRGSFMDSFGGTDVEAGLLLMAEVGFLPRGDPRFAGTVDAIEKRLRRGPYLFRYAAADDFGLPTTAFNICTFWYASAAPPRRASSSSGCWRAAITSGCCPRTSTRRAASCGATTRRPTRWSAS